MNNENISDSALDEQKTPLLPLLFNQTYRINKSSDVPNIEIENVDINRTAQTNSGLTCQEDARATLLRQIANENYSQLDMKRISP